MKSQKGMGLLMLIICIAIIILFVIGIIYILRETIQKEEIQTTQTDMLLIQGKIKVISKEATIQKNEGLLKGRKLSEAIEEEQVKKLIENNIISQEESSFSKYYILEQSHLDEIHLKVKIEDGYYIVNYDTYEIIYSKGITLEENTLYKLSEIIKQNENQYVEETINEEANEIANEVV